MEFTAKNTADRPISVLQVYGKVTNRALLSVESEFGLYLPYLRALLEACSVKAVHSPPLFLIIIIRRYR